jgi:mannose-6-phosphate isomerase-like protein (cupin superfamily)
MDETAFVEVKPGMRRRVVPGDTLMLCYWRIHSSAARTPYDNHPDHEQFGVIVAGHLDFRIGSEERVRLGPGDFYWAPKGCDHGDSRFIGDPDKGDEVWIVDMFCPNREEYRPDEVR